MEHFGDGKSIEVLRIYLDCCGADGAYHQFCKAMEKGEVKNLKVLKMICFYVPCKHDELSFGGQFGGNFSRKIIDLDS